MPLTTSDDATPEQAARKALAALDVQRKALELEAETITSELQAKPPGGGAPMGIDTPLVDSDGYPRADIDIYRARTLRGRLAVIKTDHKALMTQINQGLVKLAAFQNDDKAEEEKTEMAARSAKKPKPKMDPKTGKWVVMNWDGTVAGVPGGDQRSFHDLEATSTTETNTTATAAVESLSSREATPSEPPLTPFCKINAVAEDSPAAQAGLKEGDLVTQFGTVNHSNHRDLVAISELVPLAAADSQGIPIKVLRSTNEGDPPSTRSFTLTPRPWAGRGLLGCHIVKYPQTR